MDLCTQEDVAYRELKELILAGELTPGQFLSQRFLAERLGAAVITVRGALRRLENDGLIENVPQWGVRIPIETPETLADRYFLREILEEAAVRRCRERLTPAEREELLTLAKACDEASGETTQDLQNFAANHAAFHEFLTGHSGSPLLHETLGRLISRSFMLLNARRGWGRGRDRGNRHHQNLAEVLLGEKTADALKAIREHIRRGYEFECEVLRETPPPSSSARLERPRRRKKRES